MYRVMYRLAGIGHNDSSNLHVWGMYKTRGWAFKCARSLEKNPNFDDIRVQELNGIRWHEIHELPAYNV